ncbi:hypothetical protein EJ04DRAFT_125626 [Polyplosphaeria fusca]|uniref:Uncharacterized protein n=1 Tax=Polyplosphaeria fusca TaxID=682080 RepID=A0A9P4R5R5_9PLEO|nr:hypothetical protein EJ04DRAFT_125626 [Polyplosphaeria fusca]
MDDEDSSADDAVPPPIHRHRSATCTPKTTKKQEQPGKPTSPRQHGPVLIDSPPSTERGAPHVRNFSQPTHRAHALLKRVPSRQPQRAMPKASPKPVSYRNNPRLPPSLQRWSSLETIDSVTTVPEAPSDNEQHPSIEIRPNANSSGTGHSTCTFDEDETSTRHSSSRHSSHSSGSSSARPTSGRSCSTKSDSKRYSTSSSLLGMLNVRKTPESHVEHGHVAIQERVSVDRTSSSGSIVTISSGPPSEVGRCVSEANQASPDRQVWTSSSYDVSGLSKAHLDKCKKKGINPALYAEMKAARRGKWTSPIGGNTFL